MNAYNESFQIFQVVCLSLFVWGLVGSVGRASDFGSEGLGYESQRLRCASFILGKDNSPPFLHSTQVLVGSSFTGEFSSDKLTSCPGGGEGSLSAKRHRLEIGSDLMGLMTRKRNKLVSLTFTIHVDSRLGCILNYCC